MKDLQRLVSRACDCAVLTSTPPAALVATTAYEETGRLPGSTAQSLSTFLFLQRLKNVPLSPLEQIHHTLPLALALALLLPPPLPCCHPYSRAASGISCCGGCCCWGHTFIQHCHSNGCCKAAATGGACPCSVGACCCSRPTCLGPLDLLL